MILSFSVFQDKIENSEKCQTIRKYSPIQYKKFLNCWMNRETTGRYNLFWHNPRNGGIRIKDAIPSEKPFLIAFNRSYGQMHVRVLPHKGFEESKEYLRNDYPILFDLARRDGFNDASEMWGWFEREYGKDMFQSKFVVIRWLP